MATGMVDCTAYVSIRSNPGTDGFLVQQFQFVVTEPAPQGLLRFQVSELTWRQGCENSAFLEIAPYMVIPYPLPDDLATLEGHFPQQAQVVRGALAFNAVQIPAEAVNDLATVAAGCAPPYRSSLQHNHPETSLRQKQGGG
jgi:hypothetical protein